MLNEVGRIALVVAVALGLGLAAQRWLRAGRIEEQALERSRGLAERQVAAQARVHDEMVAVSKRVIAIHRLLEDAV